ncbi:MAG: DUF6273 domain-containing protein [Oscillospiraceae bacterium]|jgi:hypothetical protein|nr:DUF6273 domain-containing protein [Oscillospiraceae bacterium]
MKKLVALVLAIVMIAALGACGLFNSDSPNIDIIEFGGYDWLVLERSGTTALILSIDVIERRSYHTNGGDITWEFSSIRNYLNNEFLNNFSLTDQNRILETNVINNDNPKYGTPGGNDTVDKIFLLSIDEALTFFEDNSTRVALNSNGEASWWWLRSPGAIGDYAARVDYVGGVSIYDLDVVIDTGVRPALWINLES